ncbi:MAG: energy-coupling factor transporter ATPase, partial [Clostridiales bacterium]|nr:energy-coupling factor transporter ATPase [Clostridiales bacterium]
LTVLLAPTERTLFVDGKNAAEEEKILEHRQDAGMIFQNPDNQIVAGVVEEDVAFGPENLGVPTEEILNRVDESLRSVRMEDYRKDSPNCLSGGQKQRVAVAGVLAMHPKCIVMDEPTAMLDPGGQREVMEAAHRLNKEDGVTIILITHDMGEAVESDYIYLLDQGRIAMEGSPREIFSRTEELIFHGMELPPITRLAERLKKDGVVLPGVILTREEMTEALCGGNGVLKEGPSGAAKADSAGAAARMKAGRSDEKDARELKKADGTDSDNRKEKLRLMNVSFSYSSGAARIKQALKNINLTVYEGDMLGLIGHTGSGKSTLIQMFDGLLRPDEGRVLYEGQDIRSAGFSFKQLRGKVGLVFQFPEYQLFEMTVIKDAAFGPKNQGLSDEEALEKARGALRRVNLPEECWEQSPFDLSGGEKRRAAIAGVLAMEPEVLILDEPAAGMDPKGKRELFELIKGLHDEMGITVIMVSHSMNDMAEYADRLVVLNEGEILLSGSPEEVFSHGRELEAASLGLPEMTYLMRDLEMRGWRVDTSLITVEQAADQIKSYF